MQAVSCCTTSPGPVAYCCEGLVVYSRKYPLPPVGTPLKRTAELEAPRSRFAVSRLCAAMLRGNSCIRSHMHSPWPLFTPKTRQRAVRFAYWHYACSLRVLLGAKKRTQKRAQDAAASALDVSSTRRPLSDRCMKVWPAQSTEVLPDKEEKQMCF